MLITYKVTRTSYSPQVGDVCEIYHLGDFLWVQVQKLNEDGSITLMGDGGFVLTFDSKSTLYAAIGDV